MKGCRNARRRLYAAVDEEITLEQRLRLEAHVAECPDCAREYAAQQRIVEGMQSAGRSPFEYVDVEDAIQSIHARLLEPQSADDSEPELPPFLIEPAGTPRRRISRPLLFAVAATAAGLIGATLAGLAPESESDMCSLLAKRSQSLTRNGNTYQ